MSPKDPADPADPLSATGIFLNAFRTEQDSAEEPVKESAALPAAARQAPSPGEFTQMFGALQGSAPPQQPLPSPPRPAPTPQPPAEEATRIFVRQATPIPEPPPKPAVNPAPVAPAQRMKGFSAPGASDFASDDGSFSQFFRKIPAPQAPAVPVPPPPPAASSLPPPVNLTAKPLGATDLFGTPSAAELQADRNARQASADAGSVTSWMQKLSAEDEAVASTQIFEAPPAAPAAPAGPGEFTRIMSGDAMRAAREVPVKAAPTPVAPAMPAPAIPVAAIPKAKAPVVEPPKVAAPKVAAPAVSPPQSKLQQMLPILLVLNGFLLLVLIVLVVLVLLRK